MLAILLTSLTVTANAATTGWKKLDDGTWTYVKADGKLAEDEWIKDGGKWYYFEGTTMVADDFFWWKDKMYACDKTGAMLANQWYKIPREVNPLWFYAGDDGAFVEGWKKVDGKWYFFFPGIDFPFMFWDGALPIEKGGKIASAWDEKVPIYVFNKSGAMVENGWYKTEAAYWYYVKNGEAAKGWVKDGGKWYYLDTEEGFMYDDSWGLIEMNDKNIYTFDKNGAMVTGWKKLDGVWY